MSSDRICSVDGCDRTHQAKGLCQSHYYAAKRYPGRQPISLQQPRPKVRLYVAMMVTVRDRSTGCWNDWPHAKTRDGRPMVPLFRTPVPVARYVRFLEDDEWPIYACHHCDNPSCYNPDHIYAGTGASNAADRVARGRWRGRNSSQLKKRAATA